MGVIEEKFKWDGQLPKPSNMKFSYEDANALSNAFGGGGATLTVAASNALYPERADYQCNGIDDQVDIQEALDALTSGRTHKETVVLRGAFSCSSFIEVPSYTVLDLRQAKIVSSAASGYVIKCNYVPKTYIDVLGGVIDANNYANHGIFMRGEYLNVYGPTTILNTNGAYDGLYINSVKNGHYNNITIDNCYRCGVSVNNDCENLFFNDFDISNTEGTAPQSGFFLEPTQAGHSMKNIHLDNIRTRENYMHGIFLNFSMIDDTNPFSSVYLNNCSSYKDDSGILISMENSKGVIAVNNYKAVSLKHMGISVVNNGYDASKIVLDNITLLDGNTNLSTDPKYSAGITIYNLTTGADIGDIGNVHINGVYIDGGFYYGIVTQAFLAGTHVKNVCIKNIEMLNINQTRLILSLFTQNEDLWFDFSKRYEAAMLYSDNIGDYYLPIITNEGAVTSYTYTLKAAVNDTPPIEFIVKTNGQNITLDPESPSEIIPYGNGAGKYLRSANVGDSITVQKMNATQWLVINMVGTWTAQP